MSLIVDTSIVTIATSVGGLRPSDVATFSLMVLVFAGGQYGILAFVKNERHIVESSDSTHSATQYRLRKVLQIIQYVILVILLSVLFQMILTSSYYIISLRLIIFISYGVSIALLGVLAVRFFRWFKANRNAVVFFFAVGTAMLCINSALAIVYTNNEFDSGPEEIRYIRSLTGGFERTDPILTSAYVLTSVLSFVLIWLAAILLMKHYSRRLGKTKYWLAVSIPLGYFLSQFQPLFLYSFSDYRLQDPVLFGIAYNLIFSLAKPVGGILFGIAFWTVARNLSNHAVKRYMIMSAFGIMLLFIANQPVFLVLVPYPPFGLVTISFVGIASFLFYLGIYSASISVSEDSSIRQSIRKVATREATRFLDSIGSAEMERQIVSRVLELSAAVKENLEKETGIRSSLDDKEIKTYLQEVLEEIGVK